MKCIFLRLSTTVRCCMGLSNDSTLFLKWKKWIFLNPKKAIFHRHWSTAMWMARTPTSDSRLIWASPFSLTTTLVPVQSPLPSTSPVMTSQYSPFGKLVNNFAFKSNGSILMAMKPRVPRLKAIWFFPFDQKLTTGASPTTFRNATILRIAGQRCSHTHPFVHCPFALNSGEIMCPLAALGGPANSR